MLVYVFQFIDLFLKFSFPQGNFFVLMEEFCILTGEVKNIKTCDKRSSNYTGKKKVLLTAGRNTKKVSM